MTEKPSFPLEKILTISVETYCKSRGKFLDGYEMHGLHVESPSGNGRHFKRDIDSLIEQIPVSAEVVVEYKPILTPLYLQNNLATASLYTATAIALIPKRVEKAFDPSGEDIHP